MLKCIVRKFTSVWQDTISGEWVVVVVGGGDGGGGGGCGGGALAAGRVNQN